MQYIINTKYPVLCVWGVCVHVRQGLVEHMQRIACAMQNTVQSCTCALVPAHVQLTTTLIICMYTNR